MHTSLDEAFSGWLKKLADQKGCSIGEPKKYLHYSEIENRLDHYPALGQSLLERPIDPKKLKSASAKCVTLGTPREGNALRRFLSSPTPQDALVGLIDGLPVSEDEASKRIDAFIDYFAAHAYLDAKTGRSDVAGAGLFTSTLLTAVYPKRFVDFRTKRWEEFSEELGHPILTSNEKGYGKRIIEAGNFASQIAQTNTFQALFPDGEPLWIVAGICMMMKHK